MRARLAAPLLASFALVLASCGGGGDSAVKALQETASKLSTIHSGTLSLRLLVGPKGEPGSEFGFELQGPFALPRKQGQLPVARLDYTQIAGSKRGTATFVSTGSRAFVTVAGKTYALPPKQVAQLRGTAGELRSGGGLSELDIARWIENAKLSDGGQVGGADTDHVHARLNAVNTVNDLLSIAHALGSVRTQRLTGRDAKRLRQAARSGTFDLYTGKKDRLLRRLTVSVKLGFDVPDVLRSALGHVVGADVLFDLGVASPNRVVSVAAPPNALPYSSLPSSK